MGRCHPLVLLSHQCHGGEGRRGQKKKRRRRWWREEGRRGDAFQKVLLRRRRKRWHRTACHPSLPNAILLLFFSRFPFVFSIFFLGLSCTPAIYFLPSLRARRVVFHPLLHLPPSHRTTTTQATTFHTPLQFAPTPLTFTPRQGHVQEARDQFLWNAIFPPVHTRLKRGGFGRIHTAAPRLRDRLLLLLTAVLGSRGWSGLPFHVVVLLHFYTGF